ncbi:hypothetical protein GGTG_13858 [Gaeumannomyces tritici R3-111a-1]|uniref:Uncharacterized protein n=1 Tax=Gaeumannomyces tritici (strain R3-111a-1) TaxID=644352 RepID=J3PK13_GAET3|nr:hypothetical protein GGTG_13858 [Gaeumannomyces tritici R3-111a-1]EJT68572.1 hypothetical protein GGTG_13858 [Gaeumannomyces tritici R3-111a-1]
MLRPLTRDGFTVKAQENVGDWQTKDIFRSGVTIVRIVERRTSKMLNLQNKLLHINYI